MLRVLAIACGFWLLSAPQPGKALEISYHEFDLENGLHVIVLPTQGSAVVSQMVWYGVGGQEDPQGQAGIAHFLEHLMFKETSNLAEGDFSELLAYHGAEENAFTSQDSTVYHQLIRRESLPLAMLLEAERMASMQLSEKPFETEKQVIIEERGMRVDNVPHAQLMEKVNPIFFEGHPYARPVIGSLEEIKALKLEDVRTFYECFYAPNNATVVLAGDIKLEEASELTETYYGRLKPRELCEQNTIKEAKPLSKNHLVTLAHDQVKQPRYFISYAAPKLTAHNSSQTMAWSLFQHIIGNADYGLLKQKLVVEQQIASQVAVYYRDLERGPAKITFYITPNEDITFDEIIYAINKVLLDMAEKGVDQAMLSRAKTQFLASIIFALDGVEPVAHIAGMLNALDLPLEMLHSWEDDVNAVNADDVRLVAKELLATYGVFAQLLPSEVDSETP